MLGFNALNNQVADLRVGEQRAINQERRANTRAKGKENYGAAAGLLIPEHNLRDAGGVRIIDHADFSIAQMPGEQLLHVRIHPSGVNIRDGQSTLPVHHRWDGDANWAFPFGGANDLQDGVGDGVRGGRFWREDFYPLFDELSGFQVHSGTFDSRATNINAKSDARHAHIVPVWCIF